MGRLVRLTTIAVSGFWVAISCSTNDSGLGPVGGSGGQWGTATGNTGGVGAGGAGTAGMGGIGTGGIGTGGTGTGGTGTGGTGTGGTGTGGVGNAGGDGMAGGGAGHPVGGASGARPDGAACVASSDCLSGHCFDATCCQSDCSGSCRSCANPTGTCTLAAAATDPRADCPQQPPTTCGNVGACNGAGACALAPAGTVCDTTPRCDASNASAIAGSVCNGGGKCMPAVPTSCNGFLCTAGACGHTCVDDTVCAAHGFCSAGACVVIPNLAGNGDLETGTITGWTGFAGGGPVSLSAPATAGYAHAGQYSVEEVARTEPYNGPGYAVPTGVGKYVISAWVMQNEDTSAEGIAQIQFRCATGSYYPLVGLMNLPKGVWTQFTGTTDVTSLGQDCYANGTVPGVVRSASVFFNQLTSDLATPVPYPNLYVDDLVVQVADGHDLVGNPNFEAGFLDGWTTSGGASTISLSPSVAHSGMYSLWQQARAATTDGIRYALPIGAARYTISLWALQSGTTAHTLVLQPSYDCIGSPPRVETTTNVTTVVAPPDTWQELTGTFVFPPADAPAGCQLSTAAIEVLQAEAGDCSTVECPDLFVDDASVTLQ